MSDETKGATTVTNGCKHGNVKDNPALLMAPCPDCAALVDLATWRKLHPPPQEPGKSWVRRKAEATGRDSDYAERLMRETVEECCRWFRVAAFAAPQLDPAEYVRRAMLEPKA